MIYPGVNSVRRYVARFVIVWFFVWTISLILAACKGEPTAVPTAAPSTPFEESIPSPVPTTAFTPSPTQGPEQQEVILLGSIDQAGEFPYAGIQSLLQDLSEKDNLMFTTAASLAPADLTDNIKIVVALPPDPGVVALTAAGQDIQFLAIGIPGLQPSGNLSVIGGNFTRADNQGFVAGYLAAVIGKDWRIGMITIGDGEPGRIARRGFINGVTYYCGLCRSPYPPFYSYPILVDLPSTASPEEAQAAAETIISQAVNTVFIFPGAGDQAMLEALAQAGVHIIGASQPPPSVRENWVATIQTDPLAAVNMIWPELINGQGGIERSLAISVSDRNERLFSPGRQRLVDDFLDDLHAGFVDTGVTEPAP
jgi:hypothetical protein